MRFAHMADVHIGSWRDTKLRDISTKAFSKSVDICIEKQVDFVLIAGDFFNTAIPGIEYIKAAVKELRRLKNAGIPVYVVPGSHDYSPSGKTMLDVLEEAHLLGNVLKGKVHNGKLLLSIFIDKKTGAKICGILGRRGSLEREYYENLDTAYLEREDGFKIFMFHSAIKEMMPGDYGQMDSLEISNLPKGFNYYAGGHVHIVKVQDFADHKDVSYPGPLFPASFSELESLGNGGFYIYDNGKIIREEINIINTFTIKINSKHKTPEEVNSEIIAALKSKEFINTIVLIRIEGELKSGKVSDVDFKSIFDLIYKKGAFYVLKNTNKATSEEFEEIVLDDKEDSEDKIIIEHLGQIKMAGVTTDKEYALTKELIDVFSRERHEGEKVYEYEDRIKKEADKILEL